MKKLCLFITAIVSYSGVFAQKYVPRISAGTQVGYIITVSGERILFSLNMTSIGDSLKMTWEVSKYGSGTYVMAAKSLQNGSKMRLEVPEPDEITKLPDSETMAFISKTAFQNICKTRVMEFDSLKYVLKGTQTATIKIDNRELDVLDAVTADGKNEIWVLNNPDFPLICKTKNDAMDAELTLNYIR